MTRTTPTKTTRRSTPDELIPLPWAVKVAVGAAGRGVSDRKLREAVAGRVVLVTGASSGLGEATARRLGRCGATVLLVARRAVLLEQLKNDIESIGGSAYVYPCDLTDMDAVAALANDVLKDHDHVDVLVNNAGRSIRRWLTASLDRFDEDFKQTADLNYLGPVRLIMALLPSMRARKAGHIINISTGGVHAPGVEWTAYIATKNAFEAWMRGAAPELAVMGISYTTVHMQLVRTPMLGPFRAYRYAPGMTPDQAAGMVCRAVVDKPASIRPWFERLGAPLLYALEEPARPVLTAYARIANPDLRPEGLPGAIINTVESTAHVLDDAVAALQRVINAGPQNILPLHRLPWVATSLRGGVSPATVLALAAARAPKKPAIIDDFGMITNKELHRRSEALAGALRKRYKVGRGTRYAVMCRNHRGFVEAFMAGSRLSADLIPMNTDFAGPQLRDVVARDKIDVLVYDQEFHPVVEAAGFGGVRVIAAHDGTPSAQDGQRHPVPTIDQLVAVRAPRVKRPAYGSALMIMTGGTTGTPKGAPRQLGLDEVRHIASHVHPRLLGIVAEVPRFLRFEAIPKLGEPIICCPPLHHGYGLGVLLAGLGLTSPLIMHKKFDAETALRDIEEHQATMLCAVPTMLKRIMDLDPSTRARYDTSSLRFIPCGAAPLPPALGTAVMDEFGDIMINGYGSTEVGVGSVALPEDLRAAPGTVGYPPRGLVQIKIVDGDGNEVPTGVSGRIINRNPTSFRGYSGGGHKPIIDGFMDSGDVGHFDENGRLFIDGRDDDMILSGGENVFPQEVEELLQTHDAVADAGVVGVPDDDFGARLAAFVVLKEGASATEEELRQFVKTNLARYKVPRDVRFVESLPRTPAGKLRRKVLKESFA